MSKEEKIHSEVYGEMKCPVCGFKINQAPRGYPLSVMVRPPGSGRYKKCHRTKVYCENCETVYALIF